MKKTSSSIFDSTILSAVVVINMGKAIASRVRVTRYDPIAVDLEWSCLWCKSYQDGLHGCSIGFSPLPLSYFPPQMSYFIGPPLSAAGPWPHHTIHGIPWPPLQCFSFAATQLCYISINRSKMSSTPNQKSNNEVSRPDLHTQVPNM
jgi:hypothetical protein